MGTNFYAHLKPTPEVKKKLHQKLDEFISGSIQDYEFSEILEKELPKIHLGKRSHGWQFLWQTQPKYYQENINSIVKFLESGEYEIRDEYEEVFTLPEFLLSEISECLYSGYTHETYEKDHPEERKVPPQHRDWITPDGLRFVNGDFS